jgi:hypothetical protein
LAGGAMGGTLALLAAARHAAGVLYPLDRTGIYWVPLFVLAYVALVERYARAPVPRVLAVAVAALFLSQFLLAFRTNCYGLWVFDAGTRHMVEILRARENGARPVRIAASWPLEPTLNFYRRMYGLTWLEPVTRESAELPGNYRALLPKDRGLVEKLGLTVLYEDPLAGSILAK